MALLLSLIASFAVGRSLEHDRLRQESPFPGHDRAGQAVHEHHEAEIVGPLTL